MNEEKVKSNIIFRSNLYVMNGTAVEDREFVSRIHDPFALEAMKHLPSAPLTELQREETDIASGHCQYAFKDDYPWGTVLLDNGEEKVVCKCINTGCKWFKKCRPDFNEEELENQRDNLLHSSKVSEFSVTAENTESKETGNSNGGDKDAITAILEHQIKDAPSEHIKKPDDDLPKVVLKPEKAESINTKANITPASFKSFVVVDQEKVIHMDPSQRAVINAGPGTGKTWTLIEKIKYMLSDYEVNPEDILVLSFSRSAVGVIKGRLEDAANKGEIGPGWQALDVRTFDSFATFLLAWLMENEPERLSKGYSLDHKSYDDRINDAVFAIKDFEDIFDGYRHIIVDEAQDLVGKRADLVLSILEKIPNDCGFTLLGDSCQALYDYLAKNDPALTDSNQFYKSIFKKYYDACYFSFDVNYRQGDEFGNTTSLYRNAIINGSADTRCQEAKNLNEGIKEADIQLKTAEISAFEPYIRKGTVGILTRTNAEALQISSWLHVNEVPHYLQKPVYSYSPAAWVGRVLTNTETDVIDYDEFSGLFSEMYPEVSNQSEKYWMALISTQKDTTSRHFEIEDLLKGLLGNVKDTLVFQEPVKQKNNIIVSNIHRAKGQEFDTVLVLDNVISTQSDADKDDILEHKVCYVALTRPKKQIQKISVAPAYIYLSKDERRRCFKRGGMRKNRYYLSHIEFGDETDIQLSSFAASQEIQDYILHLPADTRLKLLKCPESQKGYVIYRIVPEENERIVLGYTSEMFSKVIEKSIQRIYKNNYPVKYQYYPDVFKDIYANGLCTCISTTKEDIPGAKKYGSVSVWFGLSVSGFAQMEKTRY